MDQWCNPYNSANTERDRAHCSVCMNNNCYWWVKYRLPIGCSLLHSFYRDKPEDVRHFNTHKFEFGLIEFLQS